MSDRRMSRYSRRSARLVAVVVFAVTGLITLGGGLSLDGRVWLAIIVWWAVSVAAFASLWEEGRTLLLVAIPVVHAVVMYAVIVWADTAGLSGP